MTGVPAGWCVKLFDTIGFERRWYVLCSENRVAMLTDHGEKLNTACSGYISSAAARYLPFAVFMAFIGFEGVLRFLADHGVVNLPDVCFLYLYPVRIVAVVSILYSCRCRYRELDWKGLVNLRYTSVSVFAGLVVYLLWITLDSWTLGLTQTGVGYNPEKLAHSAKLAVITIRILGAVLVVPLMEELFWRSFLIRYIQNPDFEKVAIGGFSWASFLITIVLFGVEHHQIVAGIVAGIIYNLLLYHTKNIAHCVLAHSITNLILAGYVLAAGRWDLW